MNIFNEYRKYIEDSIEELKNKNLTIDYSTIKSNANIIFEMVNSTIINFESFKSIDRADSTIMTMPIVLAILSPTPVFKVRFIKESLDRPFNSLVKNLHYRLNIIPGFFISKDSYLSNLSREINRYSYIVSKYENVFDKKAGLGEKTALYAVKKSVGYIYGKALKILKNAFSPITNTLNIKWILASVNFSVAVYVSEIILFECKHEEAQKKSLYYYEIIMRKKFEDTIKFITEIFDQ